MCQLDRTQRKCDFSGVVIRSAVLSKIINDVNVIECGEMKLVSSTDLMTNNVKPSRPFESWFLFCHSEGAVMEWTGQTIVGSFELLENEASSKGNTVYNIYIVADSRLMTLSNQTVQSSAYYSELEPTCRQLVDDAMSKVV